MGTKKQILVGAASIFLGPSGVGAAPAPVGGTQYRQTMVAAAPTWRDVGYTQDGLEVSNNPSYTDVPVDQLLDAAKIFQDSMSVSINTTFAEATLENLLVAWGQQDSALVSSAGVRTWTVNGGALGAQPVERGLVAIGPGPEAAGSNAYTERIYTAFRVISVESTTSTLARSDATVVPVSFRALPDDNGNYATVVERSAVTL